MSKTIELTNSLLKSKMTDVVCSRLTASVPDLDLCVQAGIYQVSSTSSLNNPTGSWGILEVLVGYDMIKQELTTFGSQARNLVRVTNKLNFSGISWTEFQRKV